MLILLIFQISQTCFSLQPGDIYLSLKAERIFYLSSWEDLVNLTWNTYKQISQKKWFIEEYLLYSSLFMHEAIVLRKGDSVA